MVSIDFLKINANVLYPEIKRYEKQVPGHHLQVDVKFLSFINNEGKKIKRYQYTAIDFINYVINKFPFRFHTIQADNGHEFQSKFHWHLNDLGLNHRYIKPRTPKNNGKVERFHKTDKMEFYQLMTYQDEIDLNKKMAEWEAFYNFAMLH